MSGICDKCKRKPCPAEGEGLMYCDFYEGGETRYERLFGTLERAARTLEGDYDALLEWLKGASDGE